MILAFIVIVFRYLCFPLYDYPDIQHLYQSGNVGLYRFLGTEFVDLISFDFTRTSCVSDLSPVTSLLFGGFYSCRFSLPSLEALLVASIPFIIFSLFCVSMRYRFSLGNKFLISNRNSNDKSRLFKYFLCKRFAVISILFPSSVYYLGSGHPENLLVLPYLFYNAILIVKKEFLKNVYLHLILLSLLTFFLFYFTGEKNVLVSFLFSLSLIIAQFRWAINLSSVFSKLFLQVMRSSISRFKIAFNRRSLLWLVVLIVLLLCIFSSLNFIYSQVFSFIPVLSGIATSYGSEGAYSDTTFKYNLFLRYFISLRSLFVSTHYNFSLDIFTIFLLIVIFLGGLSKLFSCKGSFSVSLFASRIVICVFMWMLVIAFFPVFSSFKYYLSILPLITLVFSFNFRLSVYSFAFAWTTLLLRHNLF